MTRVKRGIISQKKKRSVLKAAKGFRGQRSKKEAAAKDALRHAGAYAFAHRKDKKNVMRNTWTVKINAAVRNLNAAGEKLYSYSNLIKDMKTKNVIVDRKILAHLAEKDHSVFEKIVKFVR
jgi:large subunit ribosomal protein L20